MKTAQDLYDLCSATEDDPKYLAAIHACHGFIAGAVHYHDALVGEGGFKQLICYPPTAVMADGIMAYLEWCQKNSDNKKLMDDHAIFGVMKALTSKYPCKK